MCFRRCLGPAGQPRRSLTALAIIFVDEELQHLTRSYERRLSRRSFLRGLAIVAAPVLLAGGGLGGYGLLVEPNDLEVSRVEATLPGLPEEFAGLRVAHLTDLHASPLVPVERLRSAVAAAMAAGPDVVVLTGDYVTGLSEEEPDIIETVLAPLSAPLGVYAVLGNHDHRVGGGAVNSALVRAGVRVLANESVALERGNSKLYLAGVDDPRVGKDDLQAALAGVPAGQSVILLAHEPDYADRVAVDGRVASALRPQSRRADRLSRRHPLPAKDGAQVPGGALHDREPTAVHQQRGGNRQLPVRLNCPPELPIVELRRE